MFTDTTPTSTQEIIFSFICVVIICVLLRVVFVVALLYLLFVPHTQLRVEVVQLHLHYVRCRRVSPLGPAMHSEPHSNARA